MSRWVVLSALAAVLAALAACAQPAPAPAPVPRRLSDVVLVPDTESVSGRVPPHATLPSLLRDLQLRQDLIPDVVSLAGEVFDPRRLKADHRFRMVRTLEGLLRHFEYEVDGDCFLRIAGGAGGRGTELRAEIVPYHKEHALVSIRGAIDDSATSLFAAMEVAGEGPDLSLALADIFGGEIDFNSDLQPGDTFTLTFEKIFRDGEFAGYGPIQAATFINNRRRLEAYRYSAPGGKPAYYDAQGRSLRRFFLASPLKFILSPRVSSRFSRARLHPILRIYRPHLGVDYMAPLGSPVVAVAAGSVVSAGWSGGAGRLVHVRHASGYETLYMHLSSIAVRTGAHVSQGQLIGRVGSSGLSTGPHLDYRVRKDGRPINPQNLLRLMPPGEPIPSSLLAGFVEARDRARALLVVEAAAPAEAPVAGQ